MKKRFLSNLDFRVTLHGGHIACQRCRTYAGTRISGNRFHLNQINIMELKPVFVSLGSRIRLMMDGQIIRCESARLNGFLEAAVTYPPHVYTSPGNIENADDSNQANDQAVPVYDQAIDLAHGSSAVFAGVYAPRDAFADAALANVAINVASNEISDDDEQIDLVKYD